MAGSSSNAEDSIIFADNASFDGTERGGTLIQDGELWIGSSTAPRVRKGTISSFDGTIDIINYPGLIKLRLSPRFNALNLINSPYTIYSQDNIIIATSGTFAVTLPSAIPLSGRVFIIQNSGNGIITLNTTSSQTISGALTQQILQWESLYVASDGSNWVVI